MHIWRVEAEDLKCVAATFCGDVVICAAVKYAIICRRAKHKHEDKIIFGGWLFPSVRKGKKADCFT